MSASLQYLAASMPAIWLAYPYSPSAKLEETFLPDYRIIPSWGKDETYDHDYTVMLEVRSPTTQFLVKHLVERLHPVLLGLALSKQPPEAAVAWFEQELIAARLTGHLYFDKALKKWNWEVSPAQP